MFLGTVVRALDIVWSVLTHYESELCTVCFFFIPYSMKNVLKNFENCSQPVGEPNQPVH